MASKVAGHELKAQTALFNAVEILRLGISLPLIALIDYMGFRLIALGLCPLNGEQTLLHGTMDGGETIKSAVTFVEEEKLLKVSAEDSLSLSTCQPERLLLASSPPVCWRVELTPRCVNRWPST